MRKKVIKRRKKLIVILILIMCISIGYAFLSSALNLGGSASTKGNVWDVHFEDINISSQSVATTEEGKAIISADGQSIKFNVHLENPGDFYEFSVYTVNAGTIDAMVDNLDKIGLSEEQAKILEYSITTSSGSELSKFDALKAGTKHKLKVLLKYKQDADTSHITDINMNTNLEFRVDYIQANENANFLTPYKAPTMLNIGYGYSYNQTDELKTYYPNLATIILNDSISVPEGVPNWDISEAGDGSVMAYVVPNETNSAKYDLYIEGDGGIGTPEDSRYLFQLTNSYDEKSAYTNISGVQFLSTSNTINMSYMFYNCSNVADLDLSYFDTSKVVNMSYMFYNCSGLNGIYLRNFDTSNVTQMEYMFYNCSSLTSLDISNFYLNSGARLYHMFDTCTSLVSLDFRSASFGSGNSASLMFYKVPSGINIIVKDNAAREWIKQEGLQLASDAVVKTVAEL